MSSQLVRLAALAIIFVMCATLVAGIPQLFLEERDREYRDRDQQEMAGDELELVPLIRTRRGSGYSGADNLPAGGHHHEAVGHGHGGWGWPEKKVAHGWGWPSVGPVFTYVRTDGWSNFQWGVRHKVGGGHKGWGRR